MTANDTIRDYASDLRPNTWDEVCGQQPFVTCLKNYCITGKPPKAIIFSGPYGTGKSTLCRITAMAMACSGRQDDDPDPCGKCDSCRMFAGGFGSWNTSVLPPQTPTDAFKSAVTFAMSCPASLYSDVARPAPTYMDDLDEHPKSHQKYLKRALDMHWCGFIVSATTNIDKIEPGLLHRFQIMCLQPPEMSDLVPWIKTIARTVRIGTIRDDASRAIAQRAGMNYREVLKLIQAVNSFGTGFTIEGVEKVALMLGMKR